MPSTSVYALPYLAPTDPPDIAGLGEGLAEAVEDELARIDAVAANVDGINNVCGSGNTVSTSFVNLPATSSFSFTKQQSSTKLRVDMHLSAFATVALCAIEFGVLVSGTDYQVGKLTFNDLSKHIPMSGSHANVAAGLAAATYTIQVRWRRAGASGTLNVDPGDWLSIVVAEV